MARPLTAKQEAFVAEYCVDYNATQAAIRAGYSRATARQAGSRALTNAAIRSRVRAEQKRIREALFLDEAEVLLVLREVAHGRVEPKGAHARTTAAKLLGQHIGMWTDADPTNEFDELAKAEVDSGMLSGPDVPD